MYKEDLSLYIYIKYDLKLNNQEWLGVWVLWHINLCWLFNAKSILTQIINSFKQISLALVYCLTVENISIWNYLVYSNSSNSTNSV